MRSALRGAVIICLISAGCSSFGKRPAAPSSQPRAPVGHAAAPPPAAEPAPGAPVTPVSAAGVLAGQVIDSTALGPVTSYVQVAEAGTNGAPIEVPTDNQGYFTIQGLQPGRTYQLTARAQTDGRTLVGSITATPPNPRVVIRLVPNLGIATAPAAAGNMDSPPERQRSPGGNEPWGPGPAASSGPAGVPGGPVPPGSAGLGAPIPISPKAASPEAAPTPVPPRPRPRPQDMAAEAVARDALPAQIPGPGSPAWTPEPTRPVKDQLPSSAGPLGPAPVPSCLLTGRRLQNFALNDLDGRRWEFQQRQGRLVLLDFWGTWCLYCQQAVPHLKDLQYRYGSYGLEIVGIAYEDGTLPEQIQKVSRVRNRLGINYRLLLGSDRATCPVRTQFQVRNWPTLVLLDEQGNIIWRSEGLDLSQLRELEIIIRQRLGVR